MSLTTFILVLILAIGAGNIAADLTPGVNGVGAATFAAAALLIGALHYIGTHVGRARKGR